MSTLKSINPYNLELIAEYEELDNKQVNKKIDDSLLSFAKYRKTSFEERSSNMVRLSEILIQRKKELAKTITSEMGKPIKESLAEIEKCAWLCEFYAENAAEILADRDIKTDARKSFVRFEPLGPILGIMPWNYPFWQVFRFAIPTIMAGNTSLLKHASNVQTCGKHIEELFIHAGFPDNVFLNLCVSSSKVQQIIGHNAVKAVSLTGSENAGSSVAEQAGKLIKKTVLELGGNNAFVVLEDADTEKAIETGIKARMQNAGQSCIAAKRFIVEKEISADFIRKYEKALSELKIGDPMDPATDIGPLSSVQQAEILLDQVNRSVDKGASILTGGKQKKAFFDPTIIVDVTTEMPVFHEEVFGPVTAFLEAENPKHALELSNNSGFGLGINVFTTSEKNAELFIDNANEGSVFINSMVKSDPRLPFGGVKRSGYGRELSDEGIKEFTNIKTVYIR